MSELIDRQALLNEYDKVHMGPPGKARKLIEDAPTASPWHRVEDGLPEPGKDVLVYTYFYGRSIYAVAWLDNEGKWSFGTVTHWMPLPEPPKEDEHGN